jgi:hypothetical protein
LATVESSASSATGWVWARVATWARAHFGSFLGTARLRPDFEVDFSGTMGWPPLRHGGHALDPSATAGEGNSIAGSAPTAQQGWRFRFG